MTMWFNFNLVRVNFQFDESDLVITVFYILWVRLPIWQYQFSRSFKSPIWFYQSSANLTVSRVMLKFAGEYCESGDTSCHSGSSDAAVALMKQQYQPAFDVSRRVKISQGIAKWLAFKAFQTPKYAYTKVLTTVGFYTTTDSFI